MANLHGTISSAATISGQVGVIAIDGYTIVLSKPTSTTYKMTCTKGTTVKTLTWKDGAKGDTGKGISSAVLNNDYTLTITYTDGTSYTTPSIRGAAGSDASVTAENIATALGYTPANQNALAGKQDVIEDLETIRSKANSALQQHQDISGKQDVIPDIATIRSKANSALQTETDPTVPSWAKQETKPGYEANEITMGDTTVGAALSDIIEDVGELNAEIVQKADTNLAYKKLIWNQLINFDSLESTTLNGITFTVDKTNRSIAISGTASATTPFYFVSVNDYPSLMRVNHTYCFYAEGTSANCYLQCYDADNLEWVSSVNKPIGTVLVTPTNYGYMRIRVNGGATIDTVIKPYFIDLTDMFGSGNEPTSVSVIQSMFGYDNFPYNSGTEITLPTAFIAKMLSRKIDDVQINGTTISQNGIANIPIGNGKLGVVQTYSGYGTSTSYAGHLIATTRTASQYETGSDNLFVGKGTLDNVLATPSIMPSLSASEQSAARQRLGAVGGKVELIEDVEIAEAQVGFRRSAEPNGTLYNFVKICVFIEFPSALSVELTFITTGYPYSVTPNKRLYYENDIREGFIDSFVMTSATWSGTTNMLRNMNSTPLRAVDSPISMFEISNGTIPSGTKIHIYGIRA